MVECWPISVLSVVYNLFSSVLADIVDMRARLLPEQQFAFRNGYQSAELAVVVKQLIENREGHGI